VAVVGGQRVAPRGVRVENRAFDVTPHDLVTAYVTEEGVTGDVGALGAAGRA
jgi:methylthioribose-1-phosphate isomerase